MAERQRFDGRIAGLGSTSGVRIVIGRWHDTPHGAFADLMIEEAGGHRVLLAPDDWVAELLQTTYRFDEVVIGPVAIVDDGPTWRVSAPELELTVTAGSRSRIGRLLRLVPRPVATAPLWLTVINPLAAVVMKGVRTRGSAGGGRTEYYGAYDLLRIAAIDGTWRGTPLGELADLDPPVRFGFGSAPRSPGITALTTTIDSA